MSGTLYVVATPIGNLEDITLRALRVLREVSLIAAEDTRRTAKLLSFHGISTPSLSFHTHNAHSRTAELVARLQAGESIALVTDAGTPGVSDPGTELVSACVKSAIPVDPVPGVSAALAAAVASGFPMVPLTILGFPPHRGKARTNWFAELSGFSSAVTFFESPHRISSALAEMTLYLGERQIMVGRELTKLHQEFLFGTADEVASRLANVRGEFTIVISPPDGGGEAVESIDDVAIVAEFGRVPSSMGSGKRAAVAETARRLGIAPNEVYAALERSKFSGE